VFHGPLNQAWSKMPDLTLKERLILLPAITLMFVLGIYPQLVLGVINSTAVQMVRERTF
jgi:NADH-quinone oxidoreductase subunit M